MTPVTEQQRTVLGCDTALSKGNVKFGAGEYRKADFAGIGKKELAETQLHSPKVLKDMFIRAAKKADNTVDFIRSFRIVGVNQTRKLNNPIELLSLPIIRHADELVSIGFSIWLRVLSALL